MQQQQLLRNSSISWVPARDGNVPEHAVLGGRDEDGGQIYVGRVWFSSNLLPAKVCPNHRAAFVSFAGKEHPVANYEVLVTRRRTAWLPDSDGNVPNGALPVGETQTGETLYMGRVEYDYALTPGKVVPSQGVCCIPYDGKEHSFRQYSVLVIR